MYGGGFCVGALGLRHVSLDRVIVTGSTPGAAMLIYSGSVVTLSCTDLWGNQGGDWNGRIASQYGVRGNISSDPMYCHPDSLDLYVARDSPCVPPQTQCDRIGAWGVGCEHSPASATPVGEAPRLLLTAAPNPFAERTEISFSLTPETPEGNLALEVYDLAGRLVRSLRPDPGSSSTRRVVWDGRDSNGHPQPGGIYFIRLRGGNAAVSSHLVLLR